MRAERLLVFKQLPLSVTITVLVTEIFQSFVILVLIKLHALENLHGLICKFGILLSCMRAYQFLTVDDGRR